MIKIIAIAVPKGGVGKTTTAVNLAASLAIAEKKTLLIDFDPAGACSINLGFNDDNIAADIFDVFSFTRSITDAIHLTELPCLDFIPTRRMSVTGEERYSRITSNFYLFRNILGNIVFNQYEYIIIDCPPYLRGLTTIAMIAANSVIIPVRAGLFSISALGKMFDFIQYIKNLYNSRLDVEGILLNMYEGQTNAWIKTEEELREHFSEYIFNTSIPKSVALPEAEFYGKPAVLVKAKSRGSFAYMALADEIMGRKYLQQRHALSV
jgi:chromosome partitioning protein